MESLIELTEAELDAVAGGQVIANQYLDARAIGGNPTINGRVISNITPNTAFLVNYVELRN
jgi:hypothetical protein